MKYQDYSNNAGKPLQEVIVATMSQGVRLLRQLQTNGKIFRVDFIKKTTGDMRTMVCRCGVQSKKTGKGAKYNFLDKGLLSVYEYGKGYRSVPIDSIKMIKFAGVAYFFDAPLPAGSYSNKTVRTNKRTVPATTSPMYKQNV